METNTLNKNYDESLKAFAKTQSNISDALNQRLESFSKQGLPTTKLEDWKYTALNKFLPENLCLDSATNTSEVSTPTNFGDKQLVFINGVFSNEKSDSSIKAETINAQTDYNRGPQDNLETINELANNSQSIEFTLSGQESVGFTFLYTSDLKDHCLNPRITFKVEKHAEAIIYQQHLSLSEEAVFWSNPTIKVELADNSKLEWHINSTLNEKQIITQRNQANLQRDAVLNYTQNFNQENLSRIDFIVQLDGENSEANLGGFYQIGQEQHHDTTLIIHHNKANTRSSQLYKGILDGASRAVFNGMVFIHKDAQQVDATQLNKNLVLSKKAHVDTRPQLQVEADDVKAAHGATIGQLDPEELFYLMARGIPQAKATMLLLSGYGQQVFENIQNQSWKDLIEEQNQNKKVEMPI